MMPGGKESKAVGLYDYRIIKDKLLRSITPQSFNHQPSLKRTTTLKFKENETKQNFKNYLTEQSPIKMDFLKKDPVD
jgi:hypothetical protein